MTARLLPPPDPPAAGVAYISIRVKAMFRVLIIVGLVIFLVLGASVGYFNAQPVRFNYLAGEIELPLIALVIGEFVLAVLLTLFISFGRMLSLKAEIRRLRKQIGGVEAELKTLRDLSAAASTSAAPPATQG